MKAISEAQVHRFREHVAIYLQGGETVYLTAAQARAISTALADCAEDVEQRSFTESRFGTFLLSRVGG
ncbi:hypothetical protein [Inquilinus limosus]|uniref:hypothetical protein n=1 Tax=Inquilinus limosus TaxID=171674 RepID=UPI0004215888|nr:hypothetical protein [Inquilinus limosus]